MRIVGGEHRGARIFAPKGKDTRPTSDRVREAAFNLIGPVDGASVLDLFAGSGAMGLEAVSRGAVSATFVENDREAVRSIQRNLEKLRVTGARVVQRDVRQALATDSRTYDLVLCDPPYGYAEHERLAPYLVEALAPDGLLVYETAAAHEPAIAGLAVRTSRKYGSKRLTLFEQ
jgi:16S rRNA (guanine966-N2)-methyltransferase